VGDVFQNEYGSNISSTRCKVYAAFVMKEELAKNTRFDGKID
jgi:hypothetical protein